MEYYRQVQNYSDGRSSLAPSELKYGSVNTFNSINIPYGDCLLPSNAINRQGAPGTNTFGDGINFGSCMGRVVKPLSVIGPENTQTVKDMNNYFLNMQHSPSGVPLHPNPIDNYASDWNSSLEGPNLQNERQKGHYPVSQNKIFTSENGPNGNSTVIGNKNMENYYVLAASESLHHRADPLMTVFFSDENINHLRNTVVKKVKEITADSGVAGNKEGVTIQTPNMDDFFYYMVNVFQNYKIHNGSICFLNLMNKTDLKSDIAKLNTNVLQEYVSKMVSQINMYIYYYKDASQLPDQLSLPTSTSMKGSRTLEYNSAGFQPSNSIGIASYNQVGNIL